MLKMLVHQSSSTQRIVAQRNDDGTWIISKYWRKTVNDEWTQGKGIELPVVNGKQTSQQLGKMLVADGKIDGAKIIEDKGSVNSEPNKKTYNGTTYTYNSRTPSMG